MTGLDLAIFHGNRRAAEKIFWLMADGFYSCDIISYERQQEMCEAADARSSWHWPNEYSYRYSVAKDYDTDEEHEKLTLLRAKEFMYKCMYLLCVFAILSSIVLQVEQTLMRSDGAAVSF